MDTENILRVARQEEGWGVGEKGKGIEVQINSNKTVMGI